MSRLHIEQAKCDQYHGSNKTDHVSHYFPGHPNLANINPVFGEHLYDVLCCAVLMLMHYALLESNLLCMSPM